MLTRWSDFDRTFAAIDQFRRQMDRLIYDYDRGAAGDRWLAGGSSWPRMRLDDQGKEFVVYAEVPGLSEKDIKLSLDRNVLTVAGERTAAVPEGYSAHRRERPSYQFNRSVSLPGPVDPEKANATVKDGILEVKLTKAPEAQPRQITVKAS